MPSITIKSRPLAGGRVSWWIYIRKPEGDELVRVSGYDKPEDRPLVEEFAKPYRDALHAPSTAPKHETCDEWYDRFIFSRQGKVTTAESDHQQWLKWISPVIGKKPMIEITPDDIENVRDVLERAVETWEAAGKKRGKGMSYATAANVWSILTTAMKHSSTRKGARELRARETQGNPCEGVRPPKRGRPKRRHWLRSSWLNASFASPDNTDMDLKEAIAVGVGLHLRPGELHELRVKDIDFEAGEVRITRSFDEPSKTVKETKTEEGVRTVSIPDWLRPLLERIARKRKSHEHVVPWLSRTKEHERAPALRDFLKNGRAAPGYIFEDSATHEKVDFRSVRDTGITLRFLSGERPEVIQREAGHENISTTLGYAKEVANKGGRYGDAYLTLPIFMVGPSSRPPEGPNVNDVNRSSEIIDKTVARVGFESTSTFLKTRTYEQGCERRQGTCQCESKAWKETFMSMLAKVRIIEALAEGDLKVLASELRGCVEKLRREVIVDASP